MDIRAYIYDRLETKLLSKFVLKNLKKELTIEKKTLHNLEEIYEKYAHNYTTATEAKILKSSISMLRELIIEKKESLLNYSKRLNRQEKEIKEDIIATLEYLKQFDDKKIIMIGILLECDESNFITRNFLARELSVRKFLKKTKDISSSINEALESYENIDNEVQKKIEKAEELLQEEIFFIEKNKE